MKCPSCSAQVADDAAICPNCDHILDPSLFDDRPPQADDEPTGKTRRPAPPLRRQTAKKTSKRPATQQPSTRMPDAPPPSRRDEQRKSNWRDQVPKEDWQPATPRATEPDEANLKPLDPDAFLADAKLFILELSLADKLGFFGAAGMFLACFFPWKETVQQGEVLGVLSLGVAVFVLSGLAMVTIGARHRQALPKLNPLISWAVQLLSIAAALCWCLVYVKLSWDSTLVRASIGNEEVWASKPAFGVILAIFAGGVATLGTLFGLKET